MGIDLEKIKNWLDSEEGRKRVDDYFDKIYKKNEIQDSQFKRFNQFGNFEEVVEKVIKKYNSDKYRDRWYSRSIEPPESLFWFLFRYAEKYGRECNKKEWRQYGNMFSSALFFCNGYYFNRMDGQGSVVQVTKKNFVRI
jgi:hypothetical protein